MMYFLNCFSWVCVFVSERTKDNYLEYLWYTKLIAKITYHCNIKYVLTTISITIANEYSHSPLPPQQKNTLFGRNFLNI